MFTGIIEEIGKIAEHKRLSNGARIKVACSEILNGTKLGDSISINGCCQTVVEIGKDFFACDVSEETLKVTNFSELKAGMLVNLERALTPSTRMGGHIVQGHIDCIGKLIHCEKLSDFYNMVFELSFDNLKYVVKKGSIAINGISLTVAEVKDNTITVAIIPHTYFNTTLMSLKISDTVNIETDILGRYVEKFLLSDDNSCKLNEDFLKENGFI